MTTFTGTAGNDTLTGNTADDDFYAEGGDDLVNGGDGFDVIWFSRATTAVLVDLTAGTATGQGSDSLVSIEGMTGTNFADTLLGSTVGNYFRGDGGDDRIDGRGGLDEVEYRQAPAGVRIDLAAGTATDGHGTTDTLISIERAMGSGFADVLIGDTGANRLRGMGGRDYLTGAAGNDEIDGAMGTDTAFLAGARSQYTITRVFGTVLTVTGPDGTDTLIDVERLKFDDGTLCVDTADVASQAYRLYRAALGRTPDSPGLAYQTNRLDQGVSLEDVGAGYLASPEFQARYGGLSGSGYIEQLYQNVLGRSAVASEIAYHVARLEQGVSWQGVLIGFSESPENINRVAPQMADGIWFT